MVFEALKPGVSLLVCRGCYIYCRGTLFTLTVGLKTGDDGRDFQRSLVGVRDLSPPFVIVYIHVSFVSRSPVIIPPREGTFLGL